MINKFQIEVFKRASLCRNFELETFKKVKDKTVKFPVYLSAGQEFIASTISYFSDSLGYNPDIFIQHRGHSTYLAFGGCLDMLILEMLGDTNGCAIGMGGSASIQSKERKIFGHDGLMGSNVPIAVGACYASKSPTIVFVGDSAAEEDYCLSAIGWAATKSLPILFVVEDNNLSILTEKKIRRNWHMHSVGIGFGVESYDISDDPNQIKPCLKNLFKKPLLLNINTTRKFWHAGAGIDGDYFDRYDEMLKSIGSIGVEIDKKNNLIVQNAWKKHLEKL